MSCVTMRSHKSLPFVFVIFRSATQRAAVFPSLHYNSALQWAAVGTSSFVGVACVVKDDAVKRW